MQRIVSSGLVDDDEPEVSAEDTDDESSQISELVDHFDLDDPRR